MVGPLTDDVASLCSRYRIDCLYVFGSRSREISQKVRGIPSPSEPEAVRSDVDIAVLPKEGIRLDVGEKVRLSAGLEDLLNVGQVDLVVLPETSTDLAFEIIQGECLFDANPDRSAEYELYVMRRAGDLAPFLRERTREVLTEQASR
jgi:predicted nucleotidyltransferase